MNTPMKTPMSLRLPEGDVSIFIKDAFETYGKWKMEREIHLQAIRRAYNLKAITEACQQYEQWRQRYWTRPAGAEGELLEFIDGGAVEAPKEMKRWF